jgi:hypothetical protein
MKFLAYYTVFCGSDWQCKGVAYPVGRIPPTPSDVNDCYYFTNNRNLYDKIKETKWIPVFIDTPHTDDILSSNMIAKEPKAAPHHFKELLDYEYLVYHDSKMWIKGDDVMLDLIQKYCTTHMFVTRIHPSTYDDPSIYKELNTSMFQQRYQIEKSRYDAYIQKQIDLGFNPNDTFINLCGFIIRNNKHPQINELNEMWYQHIQECGIQDQLSFYFVKQRFKGLVLGITEEVTLTLPPLTNDIF